MEAKSTARFGRVAKENAMSETNERCPACNAKAAKRTNRDDVFDG